MIQSPLLMTTPTNCRNQDSVPILISRSPNSLPEVMEKDMKKNTPTTPSSSSSSSSSLLLNSALPTSAVNTYTSSEVAQRPSTIQTKGPAGFDSRGDHYYSSPSSLSSSSSLTSSTTNQGLDQGGVTEGVAIHRMGPDMYNLPQKFEQHGESDGGGGGGEGSGGGGGGVENIRTNEHNSFTHSSQYSSFEEIPPHHPINLHPSGPQSNPPAPPSPPPSYPPSHHLASSYQQQRPPNLQPPTTLNLPPHPHHLHHPPMQNLNNISVLNPQSERNLYSDHHRPHKSSSNPSYLHGTTNGSGGDDDGGGAPGGQSQVHHHGEANNSSFSLASNPSSVQSLSLSKNSQEYDVNLRLRSPYGENRYLHQYQNPPSGGELHRHHDQYRSQPQDEQNLSRRPHDQQLYQYRSRPQDQQNLSCRPHDRQVYQYRSQPQYEQNSLQHPHNQHHYHHVQSEHIVQHAQYRKEIQSHDVQPYPSYQPPNAHRLVREEILLKEVQTSLTLSEENTASGQNEQKTFTRPDSALTLSTMPESGTNGASAGSIEIIEHPKDIVVEVHKKAFFSCRAFVLRLVGEGDGPNFQWYKEDSPLNGEETGDLVILDVVKEDLGVYYCMASHPDNPAIKKRSHGAQLALKSNEQEVSDQEKPKAPVIMEQPSEVITGVIGTDLTLKLKVEGEEPISFKWYKDTQELEYCKTPVLVIPKAVYNDSGQYCCSVSNKHGSRLSGSFHIRVTRTQEVPENVGVVKVKGPRQRPTSLHNWEGNVSDAFLREVGCAIAHQVSNWAKLTSYLGLNHSHLKEVEHHSAHPEDRAIRLLHYWKERYQQESKQLLKVRLLRAGINFELLISNLPGGLTKGMEHRTVIDKPHIVVHPRSQQVIYGQEFSLSIEIRTSPRTPCTFQWYKNHTLLSGKTHHRLIIKSAVDSDVGEYYCVAANKGGATDSEIAFVTVTDPHGPRLLPPSRGRHSISHHEAVQRHWSDNSLMKQNIRRLQVSGLSRYSADDLIGRGYSEDAEPRGQGEIEGGGGGGVKGQIGVSAGGGLLSGNFLSLSSGRASGSNIDPPSAPVVVGEKPIIIAHPQSQYVESGDPLTLTCRADSSGQGELTYLWYFNGLSLTKENQHEYFIHFFTDEDEGVYFCKISNRWGEVNTDMAHVQIKEEEEEED